MDEGYFRMSPNIPKRQKILNNNMHYLSNNIFGNPDYENAKQKGKSRQALQLNKLIFAPVKIVGNDEKYNLFPEIGVNLNNYRKQNNNTRNKSEILMSKSVVLYNNNDNELDNGYNGLASIPYINRNSTPIQLKKSYQMDNLKLVTEHNFKLGQMNNIIKDNLNDYNFHYYDNNVITENNNIPVATNINMNLSNLAININKNQEIPSILNGGNRPKSVAEYRTKSDNEIFTVIFIII